MNNKRIQLLEDLNIIPYYTFLCKKQCIITLDEFRFEIREGLTYNLNFKVQDRMAIKTLIKQGYIELVELK